MCGRERERQDREGLINTSAKIELKKWGKREEHPGIPLEALERNRRDWYRLFGVVTTGVPSSRDRPTEALDLVAAAQDFG